MPLDWGTSSALAVSFVRLIQQLQRFTEAAVGTHADVDLRVILQILTVIDGGHLDLIDCRIDFADCMFFVPLDGRPCNLVKISAGQTQVRQRVEVGGVGAWNLLGRSCRGSDRQNPQQREKHSERWYSYAQDVRTFFPAAGTSAAVQGKHCESSEVAKDTTIVVGAAFPSHPRSPVDADATVC